MGTTRFVLRTDKPDKEGRSPIQLVYQLKGKRINGRYVHAKKYLNTGEKIHQPNWGSEKQCAIFLNKKQSKELLPDFDHDLLLLNKEVDALNNRLSSLKKEVADIETRFELNRIIYSPEMVIQALKDNRAPTTKTEAPSNQLFDFIDKYIEDHKATREPGSLSVYKALKTHLHNFQNLKKRKISFADIDYSFFQDFQNYLVTPREVFFPSKKKGQAGKWKTVSLNNTTVAKQLSTVKTFLSYARKHGFSISDQHKDFKIKKDSLEVIALTNDEFESLYNKDLSHNQRLDQVRDIFCFSCATGLRYSDLAQLRREHIRTDEIQLTVKKTKNKLSIPLTPYSASILRKYKDQIQPLPMISNQKLNQYLKGWEDKNSKGIITKHVGLCELAGIVEPVEIVRYRGAKREAKVYPKYKLIGVHNGRKTFASLSLEKGMSAEEVMRIGGWKSYSSFARYVNITEKRAKIVMHKAWGKPVIENLKAV